MAQTTDERVFAAVSTLIEREPVAIPKDLKKLLIISTPRSGSKMFCDVLNRTQRIGDCREWFNPRHIAAFARITKSDQVNFHTYAEFLVERTILDTKVFAINMHVEHYSNLVKNKIDPFSIGFDQCVYLNRKNKLAQAVSLAKAWGTDQWSTQSVARSPDVKPDNIRIAQALQHLISSDETYINALKPKVDQEYNYEEFKNIDDPSPFKKVLESLGVDTSDLHFSTERQQQRDESSNRYAIQFLNYIQGKESDHISREISPNE